MELEMRRGENKTLCPEAVFLTDLMIWGQNTRSPNQLLQRMGLITQSGEVTMAHLESGLVRVKPPFCTSTVVWQHSGARGLSLSL